MILPLLLATVGATADEDLDRAVTPSGVVRLEQRKEALRPYPRPLYDDWSHTRSCSVRVTLDDRGRPTDVVPEACADDDLFRWTAKRVKRDRWVKPTPEGAELVVDVLYPPPVDVTEVPAPSYWRRRESGACEGHVQITPEGGVFTKRLDEGCAVNLTPLPPTPDRVIPRRPPNVCPVTFLVDAGEVKGVDVFRCGVKLWPLVRAALDTWTFPGVGKPKPWTLVLQFDGPDAADPEGVPAL